MTLQAGLLAILLAPEAYWPIRRVGAEFHAAADGAEAIAGILRPGGLVHRWSDPAGGSRGGGVRSARSPTPTPGARSRAHRRDPGRRAGVTAVTGPSGSASRRSSSSSPGRRPDAGTVDAGRAHLVTQRPFLPAGTVEALTLGNDADDQALWDALRLVGLEGFVAALPLSLATPLGDDGFGLSAGQRARIALARATLSTTPVLLVDEPTAHLDAEAASPRARRPHGPRRAPDVVVVTHRPELVERADRHVTLTREARR